MRGVVETTRSEERQVRQVCLKSQLSWLLHWAFSLPLRNENAELGRILVSTDDSVAPYRRVRTANWLKFESQLCHTP